MPTEVYHVQYSQDTNPHAVQPYGALVMFPRIPFRYGAVNGRSKIEVDGLLRLQIAECQNAGHGNPDIEGDFCPYGEWLVL